VIIERQACISMFLLKDKYTCKQRKIQLSKDKCQFFEVTNLKLILRKHSKFLGMNSLTIPNRVAKLSMLDFSEDTNMRFEIHAHAFVLGIIALGFPKCHFLFYFIFLVFIMFCKCEVCAHQIHLFKGATTNH
jgi:hypothetical protein